MTSTSEQRRGQVAWAVLRTVAALAFAALAIAFLLEPTWVEGTTGAEPDGGSGAFELALALGAGLAAVATSIGAGRAWRRVITSGA